MLGIAQVRHESHEITVVRVKDSLKIEINATFNRSFVKVCLQGQVSVNICHCPIDQFEDSIRSFERVDSEW